MIPIDGEKLIEWINEKIGDYDFAIDGCQVCDGQYIAYKEVIDMIESGKFNLWPDTLVIPREEGYEKRGCESCISLYHGEIYGEPDCKIIRDSSRVYDDWVDGTKHEPCKYHVTESELRAAYIVGGGEK